MATVHKKGPKPKQGRDRYENGRIMPAPDDHGTVEHRLKRDVAAGLRTEAEACALLTVLDKLRRANEAGLQGEARSLSDLVRDRVLTKAESDSVKKFTQAPPTRTGTDSLNILLARNIITRDEFETALDFCECWCAVFGKPWPKGWQAERQQPAHDGGIGEAKLKRMTAHYWNCLAAMNGLNRDIYLVVSDIVIHNKFVGLVADIVRMDVVRVHGDGDKRRSKIVGRAHGVLNPSVDASIKWLVKGLEIIADMAHGDYTPEALAIMEKIRKKDSFSLTKR